MRTVIIAIIADKPRLFKARFTLVTLKFLYDNLLNDGSQFQAEFSFPLQFTVGTHICIFERGWM